MNIDALLQDSNNDGIPDAFENRPTITEILNGDKALVANSPRNASTSGASYRFLALEEGVVLLEVFGTFERGTCIFRSSAEIARFVVDLTVATQEAFPKPIKT